MRALCLVFSLVVGGVAVAAPGVSPVVVNMAVDDSCSRLGDHCVRVSCTLQNTGSGTGKSNVEIQYLRAGRDAITVVQAVTFTPGEVKVIYNDFTQAELADVAPQGMCKPQ